jgi:hypothetical protein
VSSTHPALYGMKLVSGGKSDDMLIRPLWCVTDANEWHLDFLLAFDIVIQVLGELLLAILLTESRR